MSTALDERSLLALLLLFDHRHRLQGSTERLDFIEITDVLSEFFRGNEIISCLVLHFPPQTCHMHCSDGASCEAENIKGPT